MQEIISVDVQQRIQEYAKLLDDKKGHNIVLLDLQGKYKSFDAVIVVTATSTRHAQSLANGILDYSGERGYEYLRMEGYTNGTWILVDLNDIVVHIFKEEERALYGIEDIWNVPAVLYYILK